MIDAPLLSAETGGLALLAVVIAFGVFVAFWPRRPTDCPHREPHGEASSLGRIERQ